MAAGSSIPVIDISPFEAGGPAADAVADEVGAACEQHGFFVVKGHGVSHDVNGDLDAAARRFFRRPAEEKAAFAPRSGDVLRGWWGLGSMATARSLAIDTPPDFMEFLAFGPELSNERRADYHRRGVKHIDSFFAQNIWPDTEGLRHAVERYYDETTKFAFRLLRLLATCLDLEPDWFEHLFEVPGSALSINYYPTSDDKPEPGQFRRGEHTDYGALTVLYTDGNSGLEVNTRNGQWHAVPAVPDSYIVNLADMMTVWTNDRWRSSLHRVVCPHDMATERLSVPLFFNPSLDALVQSVPTCLAAGEQPCDPVRAGEWIANKVAATA